MEKIELESFFGIKKTSEKKISEIKEEEYLFFVKEVIPYNLDIIDTIPLNNYSNETNFIKNTSFSRIFYNTKSNLNKISYFEIFFDELILDIQNLNNQISFLFQPLESDNSKFDKKKCFGFRYYEKNKNNINSYFTLIRNNKENNIKDFFILEKSNEEKFKKFSNELIDCFKIIKSIIINKYNNINLYSFGESFPIILAFSYASELLNMKEIKFLPVHKIELFDNYNFTKNLTFNNEIIYVLPIIFKEHISVLYIKDNNINERKYLLIDMSLMHCINNKYDNFVFPNSMNNIIIFPKIQIQENNSCCLWYYAQILTLYEKEVNNEKKYKSKLNFLNSLLDKSFYLDIVNTINSIMNKNNNSELINIEYYNKSNFENDYFYLNKNKIYKIHNYSFKNGFVNIYNLITLLNEFPSSNLLLSNIRKIQESYSKMIKLLNEIKLNINLRIIKNKKNNFECKELIDLKNCYIKCKNILNEYCLSSLILLNSCSKIDNCFEEKNQSNNYINLFVDYSDLNKENEKNFMKEIFNIKNNYSFLSLEETSKLIISLGLIN